MTTAYVPPEDSLIRNVPWARLRKDADDNVLGVDGSAFRLRPGETYLSATWLEFFPGASKTRKLHEAVRCIRNSDFKPSPKSGFAIGNVQNIASLCLSRAHKIRVVHEETDDNEAHVAVRRWPRDDAQLFEALAAGIWGELVMNRDCPA
jgi:hypothetical protein